MSETVLMVWWPGGAPATLYSTRGDNHPWHLCDTPTCFGSGHKEATGVGSALVRKEVPSCHCTGYGQMCRHVVQAEKTQRITEPCPQK